MKSVKLFLFALVSAFTFSAVAETRVAKSYSCSAFNPVTGYARITYKAKSARLTYGWFTSDVEDGVLSYDSESALDYPKAVLYTKINGVDVPVHLALLRPLEQESKELVLSGVTYVPHFALAPNFQVFAPFSGYVGYLGSVVPVPVGFTPTSVVTCRISFR